MIMKGIDEYTNEELVSLYKRVSIYMATWWFRYCRQYRMKDEDKNKPFILKDLNVPGYISSAFDNYCFNGMAISNREYDIETMLSKEGNNTREITKMRYEVEALRTINHCLILFGDIESHKQNSDYVYELHMNDRTNIANGLATNYQMYQFVWDTLQYLCIADLSKLLDFADKGLDNNWEVVTNKSGRKSRDCELCQIDIDSGETVRVFSKRNDAISELGIKKSHLCQCIKTSTVNPSDTTEWKKWIGSDGKKYGFTERLKQ